MTRPYPPSLLVNVINPLITIFPHQPPLLPFQMLGLARKVSLTISVALSQLGPYFERGSTQAPNVIDQARLSRLEQLAMANEAEATGLLKMEMLPHAKDKEKTKELKVGIRDWLVENTTKVDPGVRQAISSATERRRREADEATSAAP